MILSSVSVQLDEGVGQKKDFAVRKSRSMRVISDVEISPSFSLIYWERGTKGVLMEEALSEVRTKWVRRTSVTSSMVFVGASDIDVIPV